MSETSLLPVWIQNSYEKIETDLASLHPEFSTEQHKAIIELFASAFDATKPSTSTSTSPPDSSSVWPKWISSQYQEIQNHIADYFKITDKQKISQIIALMVTLQKNLETEFPWRTTKRYNIDPKKPTYSVSFALEERPNDPQNSTRKIINELGLLLNWDFNFITLNRNVVCAPHYDGQNTTNSIIFFMGDFEGCDLMVEGKQVDCLAKPIIFNGGKQLHWNTDLISGTKFSCVMYSLPRLTPQQRSQYYKNKKKGGYTPNYSNTNSSQTQTTDEPPPKPLDQDLSATSSDDDVSNPNIINSFQITEYANASNATSGPKINLTDTVQISLPPQFSTFPIWFQENYVGASQYLLSTFPTKINSSKVETIMRLFGAIFHFMDKKFPWKKVNRSNASSTPIYSVSWFNRDKPSDPRNTLRILINKLAELLGFEFNMITANKDVITKPHMSPRNSKPTMIFSLGSYVGGEFVVDGAVKNTLMRPLIFEANKSSHWNQPLKSNLLDGHKYSILIYSLPAYTNDYSSSKKKYYKRKSRK